MGELIQNLGIDLRLLVAQAVNFFILFFILRKLVYRPLLAKLDERRAVVEDNQRKAEELEVRSTQSKEERERILREARAESQTIINEARQRAAELESDIMARAESKAADLIESTERQLAERRQLFDRKLVASAGDLLVLSLEKSLPGVFDAGDQEKIVDKSVTELSTLTSR